MKALICSRCSSRFASFLLIVSFAWLLAPGAHGAAYIKFDGIDGEALAATYQGWSDLENVNQTITREINPETGQLQPAVLGDILCTKVLDKASPMIARAMVMGLIFPTVEIHLTRNSVVPGEGQTPYLKYKLENVQISSYNLNGHSNFNTVDRETLSLKFTHITMTYIEFDLDGNEVGSTEFTWNLQTNTP